MTSALAPAASELAELVHRLYAAAGSVVGQEKSKRRMAGLLAVHKLTGGAGARSGALIAGRTGSGKTMMARLMCEACELPFAEANATQFTEAGYTGRDLPSMFKPLIEQAAAIYDARQERSRYRHEAAEETSTMARPPEEMEPILEMAQRGVVFLDEFDKWLMRVNHFTGQKETTIQAELLKELEGCEEEVVESDEEDSPRVWFDTRRTLIICAGAFVGLSAVVEKRLTKESAVRHHQEDQTFWDAIEPEDFVSMGVMPELAGRLSTHVMLRQLSQPDLLRIMRAPGGELERQAANIAAAGGRLELSDGDLLKLANAANATGTGARGIDFVLNSMFLDVLYDLVERGGGVVGLDESGVRAVIR